MILTCRPRAMLFDLDGTLADTVPSLHKAVLGALRYVGLPDITPEMTRSYVGNGAMMLLARAVSRVMDPDPALLESSLLKKAREGFNRTYASCLDCREQVYPGVPETLSYLKKSGILLAVLSNKPDVFVRPVLEKAGLLGYFVFTLGGDVLKKKKPDPEPFYYVCSEMKVVPGDCVMVGDSSNDVLGARRSGMTSIGLTYGYNRGRPIADSLPDYVFDDFALIGELVSGFDQGFY